jgi:hypothetical protein
MNIDDFLLVSVKTNSASYDHRSEYNPYGTDRSIKILYAWTAENADHGGGTHRPEKMMFGLRKGGDSLC